MILIDKSKVNTKIVLTLNENISVENPSFLLVLTSDSNRVIYQFDMPENTSFNKDRFDLFVFQTSIFDVLADGFYSYQIKLGTDIIETGKALVKSSNVVENIIQPSTNSQDEFIIYGE